MAATVVLDTNVLSYLARSDPGVNASFTSWLNAGNGIVLSRVSVYEFRRGVYSGSVSAQESQSGELFLDRYPGSPALRSRSAYHDDNGSLRGGAKFPRHRRSAARRSWSSSARPKRRTASRNTASVETTSIFGKLARATRCSLPSSVMSGRPRIPASATHDASASRSCAAHSTNASSSRSESRARISRRPAARSRSVEAGCLVRTPSSSGGVCRNSASPCARSLIISCKSQA